MKKFLYFFVMFLCIIKLSFANKYTLVYTAFDGDDMIYIDNMRDFVLLKNKIPFNPEHILGYYISTTHYNNLKKEVMKDCLSIIDNVNEFWIFSEMGNFNLSKLPEGVIIELLHYSKISNKNIINHKN